MRRTLARLLATALAACPLAACQVVVSSALAQTIIGPLYQTNIPTLAFSQQTAPAAPSSGAALYVDSSNALHLLTSSGDTPFVGNGTHVRLNVMAFGAKMDGTTDDKNAFAAARAAATTNGTIVVPPGGFDISQTPTGGPTSPVLWQLTGNTFGTGTTPVAGIGSDTVETYFNGTKYVGRQNTPAADTGPVLRVDNTITSSGGTTGFVETALKVNTTVNSGVSALNDYPWGISSVITMNGVGPAQSVAVAGTAIRNTANPSGGGVWAYFGQASDNTNLKSSLGGGLAAVEIDANANDLDDAGSYGGINPWGTRSVLLLVPAKANGSGATAQFGHGILIGNGDTTQALLGSVFQVNGGYYQAVLDSRVGAKQSGAHTIWFNDGDDIAWDKAGNYTLSQSSGTLSYAASGSTVFQLGSGGHLGIGTTQSGSFGVQIGGSTAVGISTTGATLSAAAIRLASGQFVSFDATDAHRLLFNSGTGMQFTKSGGVIWQADDNGLVAHAVSTGLTATGSNQSGALALTTNINVVSTTAASTGVKLPATVGAEVEVINRGANALTVYPPSGASIDGGTTNAGVSLASNGKARYVCDSSTTCYSE